VTSLIDTVIVPTKLALVGIFIGAISGLALAQLSPGPTLAAVEKDPPFTVGKALGTHLARFDGRYFAIGTEPGVSLEPLSTSVVRKIGYGQTSFVTVATTSSGVYSSDGLKDPHVRYPGVFVDRLHLSALPGEGIFGWSKLTGWVKIPLVDAGSVAFLDWSPAPASAEGVCVKDTVNGGCR